MKTKWELWAHTIQKEKMTKHFCHLCYVYAVIVEIKKEPEAFKS